MVQSKNKLFSEDMVSKARFFRALAHPARLEILTFLAKSKSCITGDISDFIPLGRTTVNQHLKELKEVGLIIGQTEGVKTNYCLDQKQIKRLAELNISFFDDLINRGCC